jgi:hypothetical protein
MSAHCNSHRRFAAVSVYFSRASDMAGRLQDNQGSGHCNRRNKLAHCVRPEIPRLIVVKRVRDVSQDFAEKETESERARRAGMQAVDIVESFLVLARMYNVIRSCDGMRPIVDM